MLGAAIPALRAENDPVWEARALGNRALVHLEFGSPARAVRDLERCCALFAAADQGLEAAGAVHMVGWAAYRSGALGAAHLGETVPRTSLRNIRLALPGGYQPSRSVGLHPIAFDIAAPLPFFRRESM